MTEEPARPRPDALAFFGAVTASVVHELRNVFAIVDQVAGLLEDLLAAPGAGEGIPPARLQIVHERMVRQARRGVETLDRLSRFAHSVDDRDTRFELRGTLANLLTLVQRLANLRSIELEVDLPADEVPLHGDPFAAQLRIYAALQRAFEAMGPGEGARVGLRRDGGEALVSIASSAAPGRPAVEVRFPTAAPGS